MYFASDVGTPLFNLFSGPSDVAQLVLIIGLIFLALMSLLAGITLILRKKVLKHESPDQIFEDPFNKL